MKTKIILIVIGVVAGFLIVGILCYFIFSALFTDKCSPLTPLALSKFKTASGIKPIEGEKCLLPNSYLLKIEYDNDSDAEKAKISLQIVTEGERKEIRGFDWISNDRDSSVFWVDDETLFILVAPDMDDKDDLERELNKAVKG